MVIDFFSAEKAMKLQTLLSYRVLSELDNYSSISINKVHYIAAFDSSYTRDKQCAVVVVYDVKKDTIVEKAYSITNIYVPYIPGLLAFREIPGYMRAYSKLYIKPDIIIVDGHGLSHPRAFGIATHLGLILDKPSIGVAKSHLYGEITEEDGGKVIQAHGKVVGVVLEHERSKLYVSIGYKIRLQDAVNFVKKLLVEGKKLPIPLQEADKYSKIIKTKYCK